MNVDRTTVLVALSSEQREAYAADLARLERPGIDFVFEESPDLALEIVERTRPWLVLAGMTIGEMEGLALLADYGVPVVETVRADTLEDAIAAAERLGFPVAVKTAVPGVLHKSDVGGVRLGIDDSPSLEDAYSDLDRELGPQVVVARMAPAGVEIALGIVRDPQFGPCVLLGLGGILTEALGDVAFAAAPLSHAEARALVLRLRASRLAVPQDEQQQGGEASEGSFHLRGEGESRNGPDGPCSSATSRGASPTARGTRGAR